MTRTSSQLDQIEPRPLLKGPLAIVIAVSILVLIRLFAAATTDIAPDETYYLLWSQFPSASYYDHPPMVAWFIAAGVALFGDGPLGIRLVSVLSLVPATLAVYAAGRMLFGPATGERAALWFNATLLVGIGISATPDAPSVLFWALAAWAFAAVLSGRSAWWWLAVGLFAGLGVASKLTNLFLGLGIVAILLLYRDQRRWLATPWPWAGGAVALVTVLPMLMWNLEHEWITFTKQMGRITAGGLDLLKFPEFVATQFGILNPLVAMFVGLGAVAWLRRLPGYPARNLGLLFWSVLPLVAYMVFHSFQQQIQGNWLAPVYPTLALAAAAAAEAEPAERYRGLRNLTFPLGVSLSVLGLIIAANPGGLIPLKVDAGQVIRGWHKVALAANVQRQAAGAAWIAIPHYAQSAAVAYHLRDTGVAVVPIMERDRYVFSPTPAHDERPVLLVTSAADPAPFAHCFASLERIGTIERQVGTQTAETFHTYLGTGPHPDLMRLGCDRLVVGDQS